MTPRQQIKSLSVTSDPITAGLSQEADMLPDDNHITDTHTYYYVFLDHIWSRRKPVQRSGNNGQEWSMEVEQDHMVMSRRYGGQKGDVCHSCIVVLWKGDMRKSSRMKDFLFCFFLIESSTFVIF